MERKRGCVGGMSIAKSRQRQIRTNIRKIGMVCHVRSLIDIIKKTEWTSFDRGVKDKVPENSKLLIGIYYYPEEKGNPSFLSQYYH